MAFAHRHGVGLAWGVHYGDHGPFRWSPENGRFAAGKAAGSGGSVLFGGSDGLDGLIFHRRSKYCHNGGMAFAHRHGVGLAWGVHDGDHGPFRWSPENGRFAAGKAAGCGGPCSLGAAMDSTAFFAIAGSTAPTRAWPSPTSTGRRLGRESDKAIMAPPRGPWKPPFCRGKADGSRVRALWGPGWARLPLA
jgi:hypothetical protein